MNRTVKMTALVALALLIGSVAVADSPDEVRLALFEVEARSHQQWLHGDVAALDALMAGSFHFVAMNGTVETKADVIGSDEIPPQPRPLQIAHLDVQPENLVLDGNTAIVISLLHIDATVAGRRLPEQMRILSVFVRQTPDTPWRLTARSITPILMPPTQGGIGGGDAVPES